MLLLLQSASAPADPPTVRLDPEQMQQLSDLASQGTHDQLIFLGVIALCVGAMALMMALKA